VVPGDPKAGRLLEAVHYLNPTLKMPPSGKLPDSEIAVLTQWVAQGAFFPQAKAGAGKKGPLSIEAGRKFWSMRPLQASNPPPFRQKAWPKRRIDAYLLAAMEKAGLSPSPQADRRTLIRRLSFDLLGLPPSPEEIDAFEKDPAPDAYARLVERTLASPHYGERWGRHWLDLVRYCDVPESWAVTDAKPHLYRDWVIDALNKDMPYDRFVRLQLAADEMPSTQPADYAALGFLGLSPSYWKELKLAPDVIKTVVAEEWEERIGAVSGTLLGLTVSCARCHDHKLDPITTADYYALAGIFASTRLISRPLLTDAEAKPVIAAHDRMKELEDTATRLEAEASANLGNVAEKRAKAKEMREQAKAVKAATPNYDVPSAYAVETAGLAVNPDGPDRTRLDWTRGKGQDVPMQVRGNPAKEGAVVQRRFLTVLSPGEPPKFTHGSGRLDFADAVFREGSALAARVMVNRVWKHHFGRGLSDTPSNFGTTGERPTHPELLDDLAARFIKNGWSLKWLHREIVLSAAYRQWAVGSRQSRVKDPANLYLARGPRRRLEVEAWRDAIMAAAGTLDLKIGGAATELKDPGNVRRTVYGLVRRRELDDLLRLYDFPDPTGHSAARFGTTTALQQLYVLNSEFIGRQAKVLAGRVRKEAPEQEAQVERAYLLLYGRKPNDREVTAAQAFLGDYPNDQKWQEYAEVLLASNELMYVD
jgi:hypothetical protein